MCQMKKPHVFVVGKTFKEAFDVFNECDVNVGAFVDENTRISLPKHVSPVYKLSFSSREALENALKKIDFVRPDALFASYENTISTMAQIGSILGVPTISESAALYATDKHLMRTQFESYDPSITPASTIVTTIDELTAFAGSHAFPLILKPANLVKSLMVKKCDNLDALIEHFKHMQTRLADVYRKESVAREPSIIVEEFMVGTFHSIDAIIDADGVATFLPIVDLIMSNERGIDDNHNFKRSLPSLLSTQAQKEVLAVAQKGITALGLTNIPAHIEVVRMESSVKIIEIGARMGGYRPRMHRLANNVDYIKSYVDMLLKRPFSLERTSEGHCAVYELFPNTHGTFSHIQNTDTIRQLPSLYYYSEKVKPGAEVGLARNGFRRCAIVILSNQNKAQFLEDCAFIETNARVLLEATS